MTCRKADGRLSSSEQMKRKVCVDPMPHQPIIPAGRWPNLSRMDRNKPQRVEPALAMDASHLDVLGVEGATLAADQLLSVGPVPDRGASPRVGSHRRRRRARALAARTGRGLCDRLPAGPAGSADRRGGSPAARFGGPIGPRAVVGTGPARGHASGGGARAGGSGSGAGGRGRLVAGDLVRGGGAGCFAGGSPAAGCSGGRGIAGRVTFVRQVGRGGLRRSVAAFEAGGSGL